MPTTFNLIQTITLGSNSTTISFNSIPQTFTDLYVIGYLRGTASGVTNSFVRFNGATSGTQGRRFLVTQFGVNNLNNAGSGHITQVPDADITAGFFNNFNLYLPNYSATTVYNIKGLLAEEVRGNYNDSHSLGFGSTLKSDSTAAITSLVFDYYNGTGFLAGSMISIYGIKK